MKSLDTDICIVGSGIAGAIVARECLDAGLNVVMVEAGRRANGRALGLRFLEKFFRDYRFPRMRLWHREHLYATSDNLASNYLVRGRALIVRGGTTLGWTGDAYRMLPEDFELRSRTGFGMDWPIAYEDLEGHYCAVEKAMRIAGDGSDPGHPPRSCEFPVKPDSYHDRDAAFIREFERHDIGAMHHNFAQAKDGSVFVADELIDELEKHPGFRLLTSTVAERIECAGAGIARALSCVNRSTGDEIIIDAQAIAVCAGGIESPNLLLRSRNEWWPEGLGNHSGHLGCHLTTHGGVAIGGRPRGFRYFNGPIPATAATRGYDTPEEQERGKFLLIWRPAPTGYLFLNAIFEHFGDAANTVRPASALTKFGTPRAEINFDAGRQFVERQQAIAGQMGEMAGRLGLEISVRRDYMLAHHMCTTRMSLDPAEGVVDADLKVHSMSNLYVCGGGNFPSVGSANPTVTVAALAHRLGQRMGSGVVGR